MPNEKKSKIILYYWLPVLLWCAFIFYLSSVPDLRSDFPSEWDFVLRKIAHVTEYFILTFLYFRAAAQSMSKRRALAYAALFALTFTITDEYHQSFVSGRSGNLRDVTIDALGVFLSVFLIDKRYLGVNLRKEK